MSAEGGAGGRQPVLDLGDPKRAVSSSGRLAPLLIAELGLPQAFTDDPDRLARFEREAKVPASLNHPNIGGIHGLEESEGTRAVRRSA